VARRRWRSRFVGVRQGNRLAEVEPSESAGELTPSPPLCCAPGLACRGSGRLPERILHTALAAYDRENGGFAGRPSSITPTCSSFILAVAHRTGDEALADIVQRSLTAMIDGGLFDPIDGGFFRYATAADWSTPHYEKMAGDQAQLLALYLTAYRPPANKPIWVPPTVVLRYVDTVLWDRDQGYFYSSQAADPDYYRPGLDAQGRANRAHPMWTRPPIPSGTPPCASAYMQASSALNEPRHADLAIRALEFVWLNSYQEGLGMHHYFDTQPHLPGMLADQVTMAQAWLDAYEHFGREIYIAASRDAHAFRPQRFVRPGRTLF